MGDKRMLAEMELESEILKGLAEVNLKARPVAGQFWCQWPWSF